MEQIKSNKMPGPAVTVRWSLFISFALLVILIAASIYTMSFIQTSRLMDDVAKPLIESTQKNTHSELHQLFDPIIEKTTNVHRWVTSGLVKRYDTDALMDLFLPSMIHLPQCVSMMVSDMSGYEFTIFRNESGGEIEIEADKVQWTTRDFRRQNRPEDWQKTAKWILWDENGEKRLKTWWEDATWQVEDVLKHHPSGTSANDITPEELIYDPRKRIWHTGPRENYRVWTTASIVHHSMEAIYWTDIDYFFTSKAPGITAGIAAKDPNGEMVVIAYDLLLGDLSTFTSSLKPTEHGRVFVFMESGDIIGLPRDERFQDKNLISETILKPVESIGIPELAACMKHWRKHYSYEKLPLRFESEGQTWWTSVRPFNISSKKKLWVAVIIPETDLIGSARQDQIRVLFISLVALVLAMILAWFLAHKFSHPLYEITEQSRRIAALDLTPVSSTVSRFSEIRQLSDSLEVMRRSLDNHITERNKAVEALEESEARFRTIFEQAAVGVALIESKSGRFLRINRRYCDIVGYSIEEMSGGKTFQEITHPDDLQPDLDNMALLLDGKIREFTMEKRYYHKNGSIVWVNLAVSPTWNPGEEPRHHIAVVEDITKRKQAESSLQQAQKMESLGTLTSGIAHDFNNILGIIIGNTELALTDIPKTSPVHHHIMEVKDAGLRAKDIIRQLLNFSRKTDHKLKPVQIVPVIQDALKFLRSTIPVNIDIQKHIQANDEVINADPVQMHQMMMNLCINASQEMEKTGGSIEIKIERTYLDKDAINNFPGLNKGDHIKIIISDTGPGIDPEIINMIFDPYFTTKEFGNGSGMGLAVVHGIVKNHSGAITVDSKTGKGTTFTVLFPLTAEVPEIEANTVDELPQGTEKILFVDDEKSIVLMMQQILEWLGYYVDAKTDPVSALETFQSQPDAFDLVITDMAMPHMTGVTLAEKLMQIRPDIPIIICTGHSSLIDEKKAKEMNLAAFVMKPIITSEFAKTIRSVLDEK